MPSDDSPETTTERSAPTETQGAELNTADQQLLLTVAAAWQSLERRLDGALATIKGISFSDYRLLKALQESASGQASRVDLAAVVGRSPSGVTRALQPLERLGFVSSIKSPRDARRTMATLTEAGLELVRDASGVVDDVAAELLAAAPGASAHRAQLQTLLRELAGHGPR